MAEITDEELLARRRKVIIGAVVLLLVVLLIYIIGKMSGSDKEPEEESVLMEHNFDNPQLIEGDKFDNLEEADRRSGDVGRGSSVAGAGDMWVALSGDTGAAEQSSSGDRGIDGMNAAFEERKRRDEEAARQAAEAARQTQTPPPARSSYNAGAGTPAGQTPPKPKDKPAPDSKEPQNPFAASDDAIAHGDGWSRAGVSSLDDSWNGTASHKGPVKCTFLDSRTIKSGEKITLRLLEPLPVDGIVLPENTQLSALVSITSGRLLLTVTGFKLNNSIHVVNLVSYDSDGSRGLYCPEGAENIKKSASRRAVNIGTSTVAGAIASLAGQVVEAGVDAAQQASQTVSVNVLSGYVFYLVNETH